MKEVTKKDTSFDVATMELGDWGDDNMDSDDLVVPKIWALQKTSAIVDAEEGSFGDLRDSVSGETLAGFDDPIEIIPIYMTKTWLTTQGGKFVSVSPANSPNERPYEDGDMINSFCYNCYATVIGRGEIPYLITFKGKSKKTGKQLATQIYVMNKSAGLPPCGKVIELSSTKESNEKGSYAVLKIKPTRNCTAEEGKKALEWFKIVSKTDMKVDDGDVNDSVQADPKNEEF